MNDFRTKTLGIGNKALSIMEEYLDGKRQGTDKVGFAAKMVTAALKVEHMNQLSDHAKKSFALRLMKYLPVDEELRKQYIKLTNPEIPPKLLDRPKK